MKKSLFAQWVDKWFGPLVRKFTEKINGTSNPLTYRHMTMLTKEYSPTMKWGAIGSSNTIVAADIVSMDSALPLKKRDAVSKADGEIPKIGMKLYLNERTMTDLGILRRSKGQDNAIVQKLFNDTYKCIAGVKEVTEYMFLNALSTGVTFVEDENNVGTAVRIDFKHPDSNKYGVNLPWSDPNAKPIDDLKRVIRAAKAAGNNPSIMMMDDLAFENFVANEQVRRGYAFSLNFSGDNIPTPDIQQVNAYLKKNQLPTIDVVDRVVLFEKNGKRTSLKPWEDYAVVLLNDSVVGTHTYGTLAEEDHPVEGVNYQKADEYILISKYHKNDPLQEFTSSQALALPVIDAVDSIYIISSEEADLDVQTEGDAKFKYENIDYTKSSVLAGIKAVKPASTLTITSTDAVMQKVINGFSEEEIGTFEALLVVAP